MGKYLVIGGSGDIGSQIVNDLLSKGHEVILHYFSADRAHLQNKYKNQAVSFVRIDLSQGIETNPFDEWMTSYLDGLIYAAGTSYFASIQDIESKEIQRQYNIHFYNLVKIVQFTQSGLLQNNNGRIIVISSIWGETGSSTESIYSGMKAAQIGFIKSIAKELSQTKITANIITPGIVNGKMTLQLHADEVKDLLEHLPQHRLIEPVEVSHVVQYLLDVNAQSITGTVNRVNGGWYI